MPGVTAALRRLLGQGCYAAPGVFSPSVALLARKAGFRVLYFSGAAFSSQLGLPDLGVTTLSEVARAVHEITSVVSLPLIVDVDTGFGEAVNVARTVSELIAAGAAAVQIEDQVMPKRCGHLDGKEVVEVEEMMKKLVTARESAAGRLAIVARTDARAVEGIDGAISRARSYERAGVDMIFPEALESREEFAEFRRKVRTPLMANMTEFGKSPYTSVDEFGDMGYSIVVFPVTAFRAAMKTIAEVFARLKREGTQSGMLDSLMTRKEFYKLIRYQDYEGLDRRALSKAKRLRGRSA
ncbi:MAG TPA: methylisocitrate lyase [Nitrososphaerales archaeon]|nr:methylisocitrate lyase [Nitrososphaerales archaeon]